MNLDENTYILSLRIKLTKLHLFFKRTPKKIKNNAFSTRVVHLWFANTYIQFILDPYVATTYCTSYIIKINKSMTLELHFIIQKCIINNIDANTKIQKLGNVFLNVQQMVAQVAIYFMFSLLLYHSFRTFQIINTSLFEERAFVLKQQVTLNELQPNSINIIYSSIIDKYINCPNEYESLSLV